MHTATSFNDTRPSDLSAGVAITSTTHGELYDAADTFLYHIYRDMNFCKQSDRCVVEELEKWAPQSTYHIAATNTNTVLGTVRTIDGPFDTLPIYNIPFDHRNVPAGRVCELSSLAVTPERRGKGVVEHLYRAGWVAAWRSGATWLAALIDEWLFDAFVDHYQLPFVKYGGPTRHMGSDVLPVGMPLHGDVYESLAYGRAGFWDWTLEAVTSQEAAAWNLPDPRGVHSTS